VEAGRDLSPYLLSLSLLLTVSRMGSVCENTDDDTWTIHPIGYDIIEVSVVTMPDGATWTGTGDHSKWVRSLIFSPLTNHR
jgi:hypothetical protein